MDRRGVPGSFRQAASGGPAGNRQYRRCRGSRAGDEPLLVAGNAIGWQLAGGQSRDGSAEDQVVGRQLDADLTAALRALPDTHRVVAYLAGVEGCSHQEIADVTGIPLGSVKSSLHRARHRLRTELSAHAPRS